MLRRNALELLEGEPARPGVRARGAIAPGGGEHGPVAARALALAVLAFAALTALLVSLWAAEWKPGTAKHGSGLAVAGGIVAAAVAGLAVFVAIRRQSRQIATHARHLAALEALHGVCAAVSSRLRDNSGRESLEELCAATRSLLHMDRCGILVLDATRDRLELLAAAGDMPTGTPRYYDLTALPACRGVLSGRELLFVEDTDVDGDPSLELAAGGLGPESPGDEQDLAAVAAAAAETAPRNQDVVAFFRARSMVLIPLHVEGSCIGLMTLSGSEPRAFDDAERRLAELMGAQAGVILANARLIAQTRGSAEQARAAVVAQQAMLDQRDALTNVLRAGSFEESMYRIVQLAPAAVGVDRAGIGLTTEREGELVMVAVTQTESGSVLGRPQDVSAFNSGRALRERRTLVVSNAGTQGGVLPAFKGELRRASIVYAPLFAADGDAAAVVAPAGRPIGLLIFVRDRAGEFSVDQMELMRAFCVRAAGVIETARLLEQTRQDAQAKTVLLRELNHRVKNNLAGIVALLTVARPGMSAEVERWVNRAVDRVLAMATAHDLFTGGAAEVTLQGLFRRMLASVPLPPGVTMRQDLDGAADVRVDTSRAVTLAMVVNELCHNAVAHGLGGVAGTIDVTARLEPDDGGRVVVEVSDSGIGYVGREDGQGPMMPDLIRPALSAATGGTAALIDCPARVGVGLELVGGLVKRELRGRFSLQRRSDGGTTARVEFRVNDGVATYAVPAVPVMTTDSGVRDAIKIGVHQ